MKSPFYVVVRESKPGWTNNVSVYHPTIEDAKAEAERLCVKHGDRFYVMAAVGFVEPMAPPTLWVPVVDSGLTLGFENSVPNRPVDGGALA